MGKLTEWADKQSPFINLEDGAIMKGQYIGFKMKQSSFDPKKEIVSYILLIDGEEKYFESGAINVARAFDKVSENGWIEIKRNGVGNKTKYDVTLIDPPSLG